MKINLRCEIQNFLRRFRSSNHSPFSFTETVLYIEVITWIPPIFQTSSRVSVFMYFFFSFQKHNPSPRHVPVKELTMLDLDPTSLNKFKNNMCISRSVMIGETRVKS